MDWQGIYLEFLSAMFLFWNSVRIFTYVPTIRKLMHPTASGRDYSLATWGSWVCSNGFFALYLWEHGGREPNAMVLLNAGNTCMCLVTCYFIVKLQRGSRRDDGDGSDRSHDGKPVLLPPLMRLINRRKESAPAAV